MNDDRAKNGYFASLLRCGGNTSFGAFTLNPKKLNPIKQGYNPFEKVRDER